VGIVLQNWASKIPFIAHVRGCTLYCVNAVLLRDTSVPVTEYTCPVFIIYCIKCEMLRPVAFFTSLF
jgi:hypothetical protein